MRGARTLAGGRPTVAVAGGAKLANKQAARPAAPQMLGSSAAKKNSSDAAAAAANVKVAAIKPPASAAQTYANDEAPLKLSIGEAPGMGESSDSVVEMRGRASCELELAFVPKSSLEPFERRIGLENSKKAFHVSPNVIPFSCIDRALSLAKYHLAMPFLFPRFPRCGIGIDADLTQALALIWMQLEQLCVSKGEVDSIERNRRRKRIESPAHRQPFLPSSLAKRSRP